MSLRFALITSLLALGACHAPQPLPTPVVAPSPASTELADACERFRVERGIVELVPPLRGLVGAR